MSLRQAIWTVCPKPEALLSASLATEKLLEDIIVAEPRVVSDAWLLIGRQLRTSHGGIVDLPAIAPDGDLVVIEIKRDRPC
jgi:RecB family endonuclease NucS